MLRFVSLPCALLLVTSICQFEVSEHRVSSAETTKISSQMLRYFGEVDPGVSLNEYDVIRSGRLDHWIFPTGLFVETSWHQR